MTTTLTLYSNSKIEKFKNFIFDDLTTYLSTLQSITISGFQYIKIDLDIKIKINMQQEYLNPYFPYNYIRVFEHSTSYYYFVESAKQISENTLELTCSLDTLNTFKSYLTFSDKTTILRQHENRFEQPTSTGVLSVKRLINKIDEGITPKLYRGNKTEINDSVFANSINWYLIYKTHYYPSTETNDENPYDVYLTSDYENITINKSGGTGTNVVLYSKDSTASSLIIAGYYYYITLTDNTQANVNFLLRKRLTDTEEKQATLSATNQVIKMYIDDVGAIRCFTMQYDLNGNYISELDLRDGVDIHYVPYSLTATQCQLMRRLDHATNQLTDMLSNGTIIQVNAGTWTERNLTPISNVNRLDSRLIKIIETPYCPSTYSINGGVFIFNNNWEYDSITGFLKLVNLNAKFTSNQLLVDISNISNCNIPNVSDRLTTPKSKIYESKLYSSAYYQLKFMYDSFTKIYPLENFNSIPTRFIVTLHTSSTLSCSFLFHFINNGIGQRFSEDFEEYLTIKRNNELPIYSSQYVNYIKNGYNYDKKKIERQNAWNWAGVGMNIGSAVLSGGIGALTGNVISSAGAVSMGVGALSSIVSTIRGNIENQQAIEKNLAQLNAQSLGVSGSDDIDLLNVYSRDKLLKTTYQASDEMQDLIFQLFYFTGYACNKQAIPNVNSRYLFNYLQAKIVLNGTNNLEEKYLNDIKQKFEIGCTYIHPKAIEDLEQTRENWESFLIE